MRSIQSSIVEKILESASKSRLSMLLYDAKAVLELNRKSKNKEYHLSKTACKIYGVKEKILYKMPCYIFEPKKANKTVIIYLHGGAYMNQPLPFHWTFLKKLHKLFPCEIVVPIYPKAPHHHVKESMRKMLKIYEKILKNHDSKDIVLMGDSSGGGFSLAFSMLLRDLNNPLPREQILLSPWLDCEMKNEDMLPIEKDDPMLDIKSLSSIAKAYAGRTPLNSYLLSPINGNFNNLERITLFVGTREIFLPDCRILKNKLVNENIPINYFEYEDMNHVFPLYPIPEANKAMSEIITILEAKNQKPFPHT